MQLDVLIPTYNRQEMLKLTLASLLAAVVPEGLSVRVTVVDNNSKDETRQVVEERREAFGGRLDYVFEGQQGKSAALNAGIAATSGDLVGIIDDDEEVDAQWYVRVHEAFSRGDVDFIGGPYVPRWGAERPLWFPMSYTGVIGWVDGGDQVVTYDKDFPGILMGGNCVITRETLRKVGAFATRYGRTDKHLLACEDEDMYRRLLSSGARGLYLPDLIIYHYVPPERLTRRYFRRWCFWRGVSLGMIDREHRAEQVAYLAGVPRWLYGAAARGLFRKAAGALGRGKDPAQSFAGELAAWDLAGFFYGKHFYRNGRSAETGRD
ncbi:MAG TPA: glycosyltransferase family 2 protein [Pyrinomonadaceae bacterium]|jgi:glycosyltransferase involved in cell wall biosynthesis